MQHKILIVEDDPDICELLTFNLANEGLEISSAYSAEEALRKLTPDVSINDITKQEKTRLLKQEMTSNIAHELRTPVTSIRGFLETVLEQPLDVEKERHFLTRAYNQVLMLSELIQDMSLITKMEESPLSFSLEQININRLLDDLTADLEIPLQEKRMEMKWTLGKDIWVNGNRNLLYSVFRNLTDNAIRYAGHEADIQVAVYNEDREMTNLLPVYLNVVVEINETQSQ